MNSFCSKRISNLKLLLKYLVVPRGLASSGSLLSEEKKIVKFSHIYSNSININLILFNRRNIYGSSSNLLGMADIGGMCLSNHSCTLIKDNGLFSFLTTAHELGHL